MYSLKFHIAMPQNQEQRRKGPICYTPLPFDPSDKDRKQQLQTQQQIEEELCYKALDPYEIPAFLPFSSQVEHQRNSSEGQPIQQILYQSSCFTFCAVQGSRPMEDEHFDSFECFSPIYPVNTSNYTLPCMVDALEIEPELGLQDFHQQELEDKLRHLSLSEQIKQRGQTPLTNIGRFAKIQCKKQNFYQQYQFHDIERLSEGWESRLQCFLTLEQALQYDSSSNYLLALSLDHAFIQTVASQQQITFEPYNIQSFSHEEESLQIDLILPYLQSMAINKGKGRQKLYLRKHSHMEDIENEERTNCIKYQNLSQVLEIQWKWRQGRKLKPNYESSKYQGRLQILCNVQMELMEQE